MPLPPLVDPGPPLTGEELERYSRQLLLPALGERGQRRLRNARICVVGAGGLGSPVLLYLAAAGVGTLGIVDDDGVDLTNLQRQVLHGTADVGRRKVVSAAERLNALDPGVRLRTHSERLTAANAVGVLRNYDVVIDGTDNFPTRYVVNDACTELGLPLVWGSVLRFDAQISVFWGRPPDGIGVAAIDLRDLFPSPPEGTPSCAEAGVLGALCGVVGSGMAIEAIKLVAGVGEPLLGRVLVLDTLTSRWTEVPLRREGAAPAHARTARVQAPGPAGIDAATLASMLRRGSDGTDLMLLDVREPAERESSTIPGSVALPMAQALSERGQALLRRNVLLVVYCRSGARSAVVASALSEAGFADVRSLTGGMDAWDRQTRGREDTDR